MREGFENWCREHFGWDESRFDMHAGEYINGKTYEKWACWQASRAAMRVRLPATCCRTLVFEQENSNEAGMEHGEYFEPDDIHEALDAAGISYE